MIKCELISDKPNVRRIRKPYDVSVGLRPGWKRPVLNVIYRDRDKSGGIRSEGLRISAKVAEVLIALGIGYEG